MESSDQGQEINISKGELNGANVEFKYDNSTSTLSWHFPESLAGEDNKISSEKIIFLRRNVDASQPAKSSGDKVGPFQVFCIKRGSEAKNIKLKQLTVTNPPSAFLSAIPSIPPTPHWSPPHLTIPPTTSNQPNIHIIISTHSGTGLAETFFANVLEPLLNTLHVPSSTYAIHYTTSPSTITELAHSTFLRRAQSGVHQTILLLTGDGGPLDILNVLTPATYTSTYVPPTLSLHPLGTGNALVLSLLPHSLAPHATQNYNLPVLVSGTPHTLPTLCTVFSPGSRLLVADSTQTEPIPNGGTFYNAVVTSAALHASLVGDSDTPAYRKFGNDRFKMAAQELLSPPEGPHAYKAKITVLKPSGEEVVLKRKEYSYILLTPIHSLEATFTISPLSTPLSRKSYLVTFPPLPAAELMSLLQLAYQGGKHVQDSRVGYEPVEGFRLDFKEDDERWRRVCVDGMIVRVEEGGWVEVRKEQKSMVGVLADERYLS